MSHLIFRYAAAPNTNNTTAMTVTVMAAILPVKEERPRKDREGASSVIVECTALNLVSSGRGKVYLPQTILMEVRTRTSQDFNSVIELKKKKIQSEVQ